MITLMLMAAGLSATASSQPAVLEAHLPAGMPDAGHFQFAGEEIAIPLTARTGHPRILVEIGGETFNFIVDTGAAVNVIDQSIAERMGFEKTGQMMIGAPGGQAVPGDIVRIDALQVGDGMVQDADFVTVDMTRVSGGLTDGVLSRRAFREHLLTYDQGSGQIRVTRGSLVAGDPGVIPFEGAHGQVSIEIDVAGSLVQAHLDTGSQIGFMLPAYMAGGLPLSGALQDQPNARLVGGERKVQRGQLDGSIRFAGFEYRRPELNFMDPALSANVGMAVLGEMVVSLDQRNSLISFSRKDGRHENLAITERRRVGILFGRSVKGADMMLERVMPGSPAERAGLQAGDVLVSVNGHAASDLDLSQLGDLLGGQEPLSIDIMRDGVLKSIEIE